MEQQTQINFNQAIQAIKDAILQSRYRAATLVNRELLSLYYGIGKFISENSRNHFWGTNAIETISAKLQYELPGLRGFSPVNIKRMRQFYEEWENYFQTTENQTSILRPLAADEIQTDLLFANRPLAADDLTAEQTKSFLSVGFTHHCEIIAKTKSFEERIFYILPHENPSIGIILCKSQSKKIVEFAFRDTSKPMGVATYQLATQLPEQYRDVLPDAETLKKLL